MPTTSFDEPRWRPSSRLLAIFTVVELPFSFLAWIGWAALMGLEPGSIAGVVAVTSALRWLLVYAVWRRLLAPADRWQRADSPDDALFAAMARIPKLIERPILFNGAKAAIGRPPETVLAIL